MFHGAIERNWSDDLIRIARDPRLSGEVYEALREYCHQCRNRLNSLKLSLYLARKQAPESNLDGWISLERQYRRLEARVEQIQFLCRPLTASKISLDLGFLIDDRRTAWNQMMADGGKSLELIAPSKCAMATFDVDLLGKSLDALIAWRAIDRLSSPMTTLSWRVESGIATILVNELATDVPGSAGSLSSESSAWTIPLLTKVTLAHGGEFQINSSPEWSIQMTWPT